jgi:hypothetical protein
MATEQTRAAIQRELTVRADGGARLAELADYLDEQNRRRSNRRLSDEQYEELSLFCWVLSRRQSRPFSYGEAGTWLYDVPGG